MPKEFDLWNQQKKILELEKIPISCRRLQIWLCKIGENIGSEISKESPFVRPILIINERLRGDLVLILPFSTKYREHQKHYYFQIPESESYGLDMTSYLVLDQLRVISRKRLIRNLNDKTTPAGTVIPLLENTLFLQIIKSIKSFI